MKKVLFTAIAAMAMVAMVACNNKKAEEPVAEEAVATEQCEKACDMDCANECMCGEECKAANCEACPNHGTENCCKAKAAVEGQACEEACEHKCEKAEGKECCKKAEGKDCEKACEHKCEKKCEKAQ